MRKVSLITIVTIVVYFISVVLFLITKNDLALTIWELMTIIGGIVTLLFLVKLCDIFECNNFYKKLVSIFMGCAVTLTSVAHIVNITVTRKLISDGVNVPDYFKIGCWPSVEMAIDYLAWGLFVGLAFIYAGISIKNNTIKNLTTISGILCVIGFVVALFINENIWYLATFGYGIIPIYICIKTLKLEK